MKMFLYGALFVLTLVGCQRKNPEYEKKAVSANAPYEVVAEVENLLQTGLKNKRFSREEWKRIREMSTSREDYTRVNLVFAVQVIDRRDEEQRRNALEILQVLMKYSNPDVRQYAEAGYVRTQRIPKDGP